MKFIKIAEDVVVNMNNIIFFTPKPRTDKKWRIEFHMDETSDDYFCTGAEDKDVIIGAFGQLLCDMDSDTVVIDLVNIILSEKQDIEAELKERLKK